MVVESTKCVAGSSFEDGSRTLLIIGATAAGATGRRFARTIGAAQKPNAFARATIRSTPAMYAS